MSDSFPTTLINKIALQHFLDSSRPIFSNAPNDWRPDLMIWQNMSQEEKGIWINRAENWLNDWSVIYPASVSYLLDNWVDADI